MSPIMPNKKPIPKLPAMIISDLLAGMATYNLSDEATLKSVLLDIVQVVKDLMEDLLEKKEDV
jgi:hypothetical protein